MRGWCGSLDPEPDMSPPEPTALFQCDWCEEDICAGDEYYELQNGEKVCEYCMRDCKKTAEEEMRIDPWEDLRVDAAIEEWKEKKHGEKKD